MRLSPILRSHPSPGSTTIRRGLMLRQPPPVTTGKPVVRPRVEPVPPPLLRPKVPEPPRREARSDPSRAVPWVGLKDLTYSGNRIVDVRDIVAYPDEPDIVATRDGNAISALRFVDNNGDPVAMGVEGLPGPQGPPGEQGEPGTPGEDGAMGPPGATGPPGAASTVPGPTGPAGPTGATGATGPQGIQGIPGPTGPEGPQGIPGEDGAGGTTILDGTGPPADETGEVGDYYLDSDNDTLYGPKTDGIAFGDSQFAYPPELVPNPGFSHATIEVYSFAVVTAAGQITAVKFWYDNATTQTSFKVNVWATAGGAAGTRLGTATLVVPAGLTGWRTATLDTPVDVVATQVICVSVGFTNAYSRKDGEAFPFTNGGDISVTLGGYNIGLDIYPGGAPSTAINFYVDAIFREAISLSWPIAIAGGGGTGTATYVGDAPPASPVDGQLWWESDSGQSYIRYNDGSSSQWVPFALSKASWLQLTQAAYDALSPPDPDILYVIVG